MKKIITLLLITATTLWIVGCASSGNNFDENKVSLIKKGQTTEAELLQMFGPPESRGLNSEGQTTLTWQYTEARVKGESFIPYAGVFMGGSRSAHKFLTVMVGPDGKVASFNSTAGATEHRDNQVQAVPKK